MQCNVFPPVWCFMKGGRKCYNYKSCPHWMAVISELHHFCFPGENPIDTNNDYHVLINCYLFWYGKGIFIVLLFFSFVKMLYAQHNYSLGRSSFPFLCVVHSLAPMLSCWTNVWFWWLHTESFYTAPHRIEAEKLCHVSHTTRIFYF